MLNSKKDIVLDGRTECRVFNNHSYKRPKMNQGQVTNSVEPTPLREGFRRDPMIEKRFTYAPPKPGQPERYVQIRVKARELAELIDDACPTSREKSLAMTELQSCVMWANASIAINE
jgi:hypothetical protein